MPSVAIGGILGNMTSVDNQEGLQITLSSGNELNDVEALIKAAQVRADSVPEDLRDNWHDDLISSDTILTTEWPEPNWAVPNLLPTGLSILGGAPKVGKSFLGLQLMHVVVSGSEFLDHKVEQGPALYFAVEDPPRRLQDRMRKQGWRSGLPATFLTLGSFEDRIGDLRCGGAERIARQIQIQKHRLVVIDTLSRALRGDQNDVREMTAWLSPLQEMAHTCGCAVLLIDHHRKSGGFDVNVIADILGSTAKGAMVDTALGLYKDRGKVGARLAISGREVPEKIINLHMNWETGCWLLDNSSSDKTALQTETLDALIESGPSGVTELALAVYGDKKEKGSIYNHLKALRIKGYVIKRGKLYEAIPQDD